MAKKPPMKAAKPAAASSGMAELQAFKDAVQNLAVAGRALVKAARANPELQRKSALRNALDKMQDTADRLRSSVPRGGPTPTIDI